MPVEKYGSTQVREIRFTPADVRAVIVENAKERLDNIYDFAYDQPIILKDGEDTVVRFVQKSIVQDGDSRLINLKPLEKKK